jgi:peptidoglycan/LPS O-acetylase OafA/YrhL
MRMSHIRQLDGLRAIAVGLVFVAHCRLDAIVPGGLGVTIFFFLSGYLITSLMRSEIAQTNRLDFKAFMMRRTLRIWPPLYITLALALVTVLLVFPDRLLDPWVVVAQAGFFNNYVRGSLTEGAGLPLPLWSLAVEEHYYLAFPLLYLFLSRALAPRQIAWACFGLCLVVLAIRTVIVARHGPLHDIYFWSHTRIDSILFGSCLAAFNNPVLDKDAWRPRLWHFGAALLLLLACLAIRNPIFRETIRYSLQGAALYVIFSYIISDRGKLSALLNSPPLQIVGLYSYTFYLVHMLVIDVIDEAFPGMPTAGLIVSAGVISLIYSAAMYRFVERPMALWRKRFHAVDANATVAPADPLRAMADDPTSPLPAARGSAGGPAR